MSYSTNVRINEKDKSRRNQDNLQLVNFALTQYKKYYNNIYFITDAEGKELFKDVKFTEIFNILDIVPKKYEDVWSLGKMYAIRHIASLKKQFCHSDMDFFIKKPFKENIINAEVFAQSYEYNPDVWGLYYRIQLFNDLCKNKYLATDAFKKSDFTDDIYLEMMHFVGTTIYRLLALRKPYYIVGHYPIAGIRYDDKYMLRGKHMLLENMSKYPPIALLTSHLHIYQKNQFWNH